MALKKYRPTSPGRRSMTTSNYKDVTRDKPERSLLTPLSKSGGRNSHGRMTVRHVGGGHKRRYRVVDFRRNKDGIPAKVFSVEYDPNRSSRIALLHYADGEKRYILAPNALRPGDSVESGPGTDIKPGNAMALHQIPVGTIVHAVELKPGKGAQLGRSAGTGIQVMAKEGVEALLKLPSGELRKVQLECRATIGQVGNLEHDNIKLGKAGRKRWLGRRSGVRGVAMNPVDHPHGGGEGRAKGNHPQTPWGKPTKGYKTRRNKSSDKYIVARRSRK